MNLRDFGRGNYKQLDDYAFGSGGMLFAAPQLKDALNFATHNGVKPFVIFPSPQGVLISQELNLRHSMFENNFIYYLFIN